MISSYNCRSVEINYDRVLRIMVILDFFKLVVKFNRNVLSPSSGYSLVQVGGKELGRKKYVDFVRRTEGMFANPSYGKGGQGLVPSNRLSGKMGSVTNIRG